MLPTSIVSPIPLTDLIRIRSEGVLDGRVDGREGFTVGVRVLFVRTGANGGCRVRLSVLLDAVYSGLSEQIYESSEEEICSRYSTTS